MKAGLITQLNQKSSNLPDARRLALPLESLGVSQYNSRSWRRRVPAVLIASLLLAILLVAAGISIDGAPWLVLLPLVCLPLAAAVALKGS
jgi:fatty acid desaturase